MRRIIGLCVAALTVGAVQAASTGTAVSVALGCNSPVQTSVVLTADVGPCPAGGLIVAASNITIDLGGHRILGTPDTGDGSGIFMGANTDIRVLNGTIEHFDFGLRIQQSQRVSVSGLIVARNAVGIQVTDAVTVSIARNAVKSNGPGAGISITGDASRSVSVSSNEIVSNNVPRPTGNMNVSTGITVANGRDHSITGNLIADNGLYGVHVLGPTGFNTLSRNLITRNGFHQEGNEKGGGIRMRPPELRAPPGQPLPPNGNSLIAHNSVTANAANGILVEAVASTFLGNMARGNGTFTNAANGLVFDLHDRNAACGSNTWTGNAFGTAFPSCVS